MRKAIAAALCLLAAACGEVTRKEAVGFACPIIENAARGGDGNGNVYDYSKDAAEGTWKLSGPWGRAGAPVTARGNSRCSGTGGTYLDIDKPKADKGRHCWCRIKNGGLSGAWVFLGDYDSAPYCAQFCASSCVNYVSLSSDFRAKLCQAPANKTSD